MEGIYKCTAENKANATISLAYLHVFGRQKKESTLFTIIAVTK